MTTYEKIKSMSFEEMVNAITDFCDENNVPTCVFDNDDRCLECEHFVGGNCESDYCVFSNDTYVIDFLLREFKEE